MAEVIPFRINVSEAELADLRRRLRQTRWPSTSSTFARRTRTRCR
jgi:hypothetical protein